MSPLDGLRVVDCTRGTAGPRATGLLADYGADVTWVVPPGGDPCRDALAPAYAMANRAKRVVELDVHSDLDAVLALCDGADVFVQSWRPDVAERRGLGYDALHARFPSLVYGHITGFGLDGPHRDLPGHEALVHAIVGTMAEQVGHRDGPIYEGLPFASAGAAYLALIGVLAALHRRHHDGIGRFVETSLLDGALAYLSMVWGTTDAAPAAPLQARAGTGRLVAGTFRCRDDRYVGIHTGAVGAFGRLLKVVGLDDRIPASESGRDMGVPLTDEQAVVMREELPRVIASEPLDVWIERLAAADVCAIPQLHPTECFDEPQVLHNQMVLEVDDPVLGRVQGVAPPIRFSGSGHVRPNGNRNRPEPEGGGVLAGVHVLDLGAFYAGPFASRLLADLGADVIKLEPTAGDPLRGLERPFRGAQAGKRSLAANLKAPELAPAIERLIEWADVVQHNMRPGAAERLGLGYEQVRERNPGAVYLYSPGWGSTGPDRDRQSFAPMISGYVGVAFEVAGQYNEPMFPVGNEDPGAGLVGAIGILMALLERQRTGAGQYVESPQLNAAMAHVTHIVRTADGTVIGADRLDPLAYGVGALDRLYETADGWICLVATSADGLDLPDDDYERSIVLRDRFAVRKTDELIAELAAIGVAAVEPVPYNNVAFMTDLENVRSGRVAVCPHPTQGAVREVAALVRVSDAEVPPHRVAPELGAHTDDILAWLGYDDATIADLRARGEIR